MKVRGGGIEQKRKGFMDTDSSVLIAEHRAGGAGGRGGRGDK